VTLKWGPTVVKASSATIFATVTAITGTQTGAIILHRFEEEGDMEDSTQLRVIKHAENGARNIEAQIEASGAPYRGPARYFKY
jgi:hypothetical protein